MLFLAIGFAIMTIGSVLAGLSFELLGLSLRQVSIVETIMIVIGFIMLLYSVYGTDWGSNTPYSNKSNSRTLLIIYGSFFAISIALS